MATDYNKWDKFAADVDVDEAAESRAADAARKAAVRREAEARVAARGTPVGRISKPEEVGVNYNAGTVGPVPDVTDAAVDDMIKRLGLPVVKKKGRKGAKGGGGDAGSAAGAAAAGAGSEPTSESASASASASGAASRSVTTPAVATPASTTDVHAGAGARADAGSSTGKEADGARGMGDVTDGVIVEELLDSDPEPPPVDRATKPTITPGDADAALRTAVSGTKAQVRRSQAKKHGTDYAKWDKLAAEISDSDDDAGGAKDGKGAASGSTARAPADPHNAPQVASDILDAEVGTGVSFSAVIQMFTVAVLLAAGAMTDVDAIGSNWGKVIFFGTSLGLYYCEVQCAQYSPQQAKWRGQLHLLKSVLVAAALTLLAGRVLPDNSWPDSAPVRVCMGAAVGGYWYWLLRPVTRYIGSGSGSGDDKPKTS